MMALSEFPPFLRRLALLAPSSATRTGTTAATTAARSRREPYLDAQFHQQYLHEAESYLHRVADPFTKDFDANSMLYLLQTWNHFDLAVKHGTLARAMEPVRAKMMIIAATGDNLFPPYLSEEIVKAMQVNGRPVWYELMEDDYGHDFFLIPEIIQEKIAPPLVEFLEKD